MSQPGERDGAAGQGLGSADAEALRMARLLYPICLWMLALLAVLSLLVLHPGLSRAAGLAWFDNGLLAAVLVAVLVLLRARRVRLAAAVFTGALWFLLLVMTAFLGGLGGPLPPVLVAFGVLVGFLWGARGVLVYTAGTAVLGAGLMGLQLRGLGPQAVADLGPLDGWLMLVSALVIAGVVTWLAQRSMRELLETAQRNERTALEASRAVEAGRAQLERRIGQQVAVAELGRKALSEDGAEAVMWEAARAIERTLDVTYVSVMEYRPAEDVLVLRAGAGWPEGAYGTVRVPVSQPTQAAHTLRTRESVVVEDLRADARFPLNEGMRDLGVVSSVSVVVLGEGEPFGVIGAHAPERRAYGAEDIRFLEAVGHLLALAIRRERSAEALRAREAELRQAQKMEAVGRLAGGIAHDFNNLLTAIAGYTSFVLQSLDPEHPARADAEEVRRLTEQAASLTRQILSFSRPQMVRAEVIDLNAVIRDAEGLLRRTIGEDVEFVTRLADGAAPVRSDPAQMEQVLLNLVVNARDAMPGGGRLEVRTLHERDPADGGAVVALEVSDTGCGMDPETQARAFDPFFTTKDRFKGTGLGLSTVYGIVQQNRGSVSLASQPGRGTTLRIVLPAARGEPLAEAHRRVRLPPGGTETVLLAEDEPAVRRLMRRVLDGAGYEVLEAADGSQALALAREHGGAIHLVLTDVVMPQMGGAELVEQMEAIHPEARILYVSGYAEDAARARGTLPRGGAFLAKPFSAEELARRVRAVLDAEPAAAGAQSAGAATPS